MKLRFLSLNLMVFCFILVQGVIAEMPSISINEVNLHRPVAQELAQDQALRNNHLKSCFIDGGFGVVLGKDDGCVVSGELLGLDRSGYQDHLLMPRLPHPIKELAYNSILNAVVVSTAPLRSFWDGLEDLAGDVATPDTVILCGIDGRVLWRESVPVPINTIASSGNYVVFASRDRLFVRNIKNSSDNHVVTFNGVQSISFWRETVIFCVFDSHVLLYDMESRHVVFDVTLAELGLINSSLRRAILSEEGVLVVVTARGMTAHTAYRVDPTTIAWRKLDFLDRKASPCSSVNIYDKNKVLCGIGNCFISSSTVNISYDFILLRSTDFSSTDRIILKFDPMASVLNATVTGDNKLVVLVAVKDNLRVLTISFGVGSSLFQATLDREIGLDRSVMSVFPRLSGTWNVNFDDDLDRFVIKVKSEVST